MTRTHAETLRHVLGFFRHLVHDDAMRADAHAHGIGDRHIDDAFDALERACEPSPNSPTTCDDCRASSPCASPRQLRLF